MANKTFELSEIKKNLTWQEAINYAISLGEGWRLPTREELQIIQASPKSKKFATEGLFWSSSTYVCDTSYAWYVDFDYGDVNNDYKTDTYDARCVRGSFDSLINWCFSKEQMDTKEEPTRNPLKVYCSLCERAYLSQGTYYCDETLIIGPGDNTWWAPGDEKIGVIKHLCKVRNKDNNCSVFKAKVLIR